VAPGAELGPLQESEEANDSQEDLCGRIEINASMLRGVSMERMRRVAAPITWLTEASAAEGALGFWMENRNWFSLHSMRANTSENACALNIS
jgi:hypothetical protein